MHVFAHMLLSHSSLNENTTSKFGYLGRCNNYKPKSVVRAYFSLTLSHTRIAYHNENWFNALLL